MKHVIATKDSACEVCGSMICIGEVALVRYDYDWDNPDEDEQGSVQVPFYRHADPEACENGLRSAQLKAEIDAQWEEDQFHRAIF